MIVAGVLHTGGIEDVCFQDLLVGFACDALDDGAEEKVTGVVVGIFRAGVELEIAARILLYKLIDLVRVAADVLKEAGLACVTRNARGVREQVMDCYFVPGVFSIFRQVVRQLRIELDLSLFYQLKNDGRRELLRNRPKPKLRIGRVRNSPLHIREPKSALVSDLPILGD